ncbi:hypothetical protein F8G81_07585 [Arthrobacter sp. CDRTa11]|uniref:hypothetical protein n=1 Tax=Arthrobacter sp. CDRTa11 TaxID=2651199 RepID=UPI002265941E|nr:hypothetical protein [Arthrobacter sp. CDRTa11]UZX02494.1 hypothetical protein F8G81_07585 [Arthrobacter sp. CDRTa11]
MLVHNGIHPAVVDKDRPLFYDDETSVLSFGILPLREDYEWRQYQPKVNRSSYEPSALKNGQDFPVVEVKLWKQPWEFGVLLRLPEHESLLAGGTTALMEGAL